MSSLKTVPFNATSCSVIYTPGPADENPVIKGAFIEVSENKQTLQLQIDRPTPGECAAIEKTLENFQGKVQMSRKNLRTHVTAILDFKALPDIFNALTGATMDQETEGHIIQRPLLAQSMRNEVFFQFIHLKMEALKI